MMMVNTKNSSRSQIPRFVLSCILILLFISLAAPFVNAGPTQIAAAPAQDDQNLGKLSLEDLMNISVMDEPVSSVNKQESDVRHSAAAVFVITQEMIRRSGATVIPELFRMVPGMTVARIDNSKWAIGSRGFTDRFVGKLLVQINGRTLYNAVTAGVYWDTVADYPLEDIERIEVIRGPGASIWGANAVNGVINIITKSSKETKGGLFQVGGGNTEHASSSLRYSGKAGEKLNYRVYGRGFQRGKQFSGEGDPHDAWWGSNDGLIADWDASEKDSVSMDGGYLFSDAGRNDRRDRLTSPFSFNNIEDEKTNAEHMLSRWTHKTGDESDWSLQGYWDRFARSTTNNLFDFHVNAYDLDFQHHFPLGERQKIIYGLAYRWNHIVFRGSEFDSGFDIGPALISRDTHLFSTFFQDQLAIIEDKLFLIGGTKIEHNTFTGVEVQPTARILFTPTAKQTIWAAFSRAVRTPSLLESNLQISLLGGPVFPRIEGNESVGSQVLRSFEIGYRVEPIETVSADIAWFYNNYDNLFTTEPGGVVSGPEPGTSISRLNRGNRMGGETYGVEVSSSWQATQRWRLTGTYSFLRMTLHRDGGDPLLSSTAEAAEGQSPKHQATLQSSWNFPHDVELDLIGRYVDTLEGFNLTSVTGVRNKIESYLSLNARLGWKLNQNWELALIGQNLIGHHPEFGTSALISSPVVEIERGIYATATLRWGEK